MNESRPDAPGAEPAGPFEREVISDSAALLELSSILNASLDLPFILSNVLLSSMGKLLATRGVVLVEHQTGIYRLASVKGVVQRDLGEDFSLPVEWEGFFFVSALEDSSDDHVRRFASCCVNCGITVLVPMRVEDRMVGILALGPRLNGATYDSAAATFLESMAAVAASAIKNAVTVDALRDVNRQLDAKIQEMNTLFELSREMNATFAEQDILRTLSYALMGQMRVTRYVVFVREGEVMRAMLVKLPGFAEESAQQAALQDITDAVRLDVDRPPANEFEAWLAGYGISVLIPMLVQQQTRGLLCVGGRFDDALFTDVDIEYLGAVASITITALENARLVREMVEKERLEQELDLARTIQKGLLPDRLPRPAGYDIVALNESSQQVGGDYYDVIELTPTRHVLAIGDVSGKGIPASLLMANVQAAFRTIAPLELPPAEATARINTLVHANTDVDKFITFFWGILDADAHTFTYVNAGHNPPWLVHREGTMQPLTEGGLILGVLPDPPPYATETVPLHPGDSIVMYTDGVNEAMSVTMEEFGDDRLQGVLYDCSSDSADVIMESISAAVHRHTARAAQSDDITLLIVQRSG